MPKKQRKQPAKTSQAFIIPGAKHDIRQPQYLTTIKQTIGAIR